MSTWLFAAVLGLLGISYLVVGAVASRNQSGEKGYFLARRKLGVFSLALSIMATQLGGGVVLGTAAEAASSGWSVYLWPFGSALGLMALGFGIGARLRKAGVSTLAELFESRYNSPLLRRVAATLSIASLFLILVAQLIASQTFLAALGITSPWIFALIWSVVIAYTVIGGLKAVVYTDVLQTLVIVGGLALAATTAFFAIPSLPLTASIPSAPLTNWFLMPFLFMVIGQDMGQRCFAAQNPRTVSRAFILGGIGIALVGLLPVALGTMAGGIGISGDQTLLTALTQLTNPTVAALASCGIVVALISTVDSLLCAISSNLASDFPWRPSLRLCQLITLLVGAAALATSFLAGSVTSWLLLAYNLSVSALAVPLLAALFFPNRAAAYASVTLGLLTGSLVVSALAYAATYALTRTKVLSW